MEIVLVWSCIILLIVIVGMNTFSKSSSRHIQTFKIPWSCELKGKFIEKIMHCVLKINIDVNIILDLTKILFSTILYSGDICS